MRRRDEVLVGLFTTVAIIILALTSIWLVRGGLNRGYLLHSRFSWGAGIKQGAPVWLVGVTVGTVDKVDLDPRGTLLITYRIRKEHSVPVGSVATRPYRSATARRNWWAESPSMDVVLLMIAPIGSGRRGSDLVGRCREGATAA